MPLPLFVGGRRGGGSAGRNSATKNDIRTNFQDTGRRAPASVEKAKRLRTPFSEGLTLFRDLSFAPHASLQKNVSKVILLRINLETVAA